MMIALKSYQVTFCFKSRKVLDFELKRVGILLKTVIVKVLKSQERHIIHHHHIYYKSCMYKVSPNTVYKLAWEVDNIVRNHTEIGQHAIKSICGTLCEPSRSANF